MRICTLLLTSLVMTGCGVERTLTIKSEPPGALVYLNGTEIGRTPVTRDFTWYGTYDLELRKDGYQTLKTRGKVIAPWWQWVPIDLFAELVPAKLYDRQHLEYAMKPAHEEAANPAVMVKHAGELRAELQSSPRTRAPLPEQRSATQPAAEGVQQ